jgi:hypothetical protein
MYEICPYLDLESRLSLFEAFKCKVYQPIPKEKFLKTLSLLQNIVYPKLPLKHEDVLPTYIKCICVLRDVRKYGNRKQVLSYALALLESVNYNINFITNDPTSEHLPQGEEGQEFLLKLMQLLDKIKSILHGWKIRDEISEH